MLCGKKMAEIDEKTLDGAQGECYYKMRIVNIFQKRGEQSKDSKATYGDTEIPRAFRKSEPSKGRER